MSRQAEIDAARKRLNDEILLLTAFRDGEKIQFTSKESNGPDRWADLLFVAGDDWRPDFRNWRYRIKPKMASHSTKAYLYQSMYTGRRVALYGHDSLLVDLKEWVLVATTDVTFVWEEKK